MTYRSIFRPDLFDGRTIVVTGGGSGIGRCTAHELASLGAHAVLIGRSEEKLKQVEQEIVADGGSASGLVCDIRKEDEVAAAVGSVVSESGPIAGLLNNAGGQYISPAEKITQKGFEAVVRTNLIGGFLFAREVYNQSMKENGGSIVNITADNFGGMPLMAHSGAARAGMENLTMTTAVEWAGSGTRVNSIAPGYIASSGLDTYGEEAASIIRSVHKAIPLQRWGTESEVSAAVCFLLSDAASYITGATLRVDGASGLADPLWPQSKQCRSTPFEGFHRGALPAALKKN